MSETYTGSCLCGAIKYAVAEFMSSVGNCHCRMCRKHTGAAFATYAGVKTDNFRWLAGERFLKKYAAANRTLRTFCGECGSSLIFSSENGSTDVIELSLATLDVDSPVKPDAHIFVDYKANWTELNDDLPKFQAGRDSSPAQKA